MRWQVHPLFQSGQYRRLADEWVVQASSKDRCRYVASIVGALSFLGRMEEAEQYFAAILPGPEFPLNSTAARFFLAIGWTRRSEYQKAKMLLEQNALQLKNSSALLRFFVHQGWAFFYFYLGRLAPCVDEAELAWREAISSEDNYACCLATDCLGHVKIKNGQIHAGLGFLKQAEGFAKKIGNSSSAGAIAISQELYSAEFGLSENPTKRLESLWQQVGPENNYSKSSIGLELARQLTLRGRYREAERLLESAASLVFASQNRRHEITLNLRLAELAGRRGEFFQARHFLWFSKRLLHAEVDGSLELQVLGIERKLQAAEKKSTESLDGRWKILSNEYSTTRDRNIRFRLGFDRDAVDSPEDQVHRTILASRAEVDLSARLEPLIGKEYLSEAALCLGFTVGEPVIAILSSRKGLLMQSKDGVYLLAPLTSIQEKILRVLGENFGENVNKEILVKKVWRYEYSPLRHDRIVYAAISGLRKSLHQGHDWIAASDDGYRLNGRLVVRSQTAKKENAVKKSLAETSQDDSSGQDDLNYRQMEIIEWLSSARFITVQDCRKKFDSSEITALRDLSSLCRLGFVVRVGKARATRYTLAKRGAQL